MTGFIGKHSSIWVYLVEFKMTRPGKYLLGCGLLLGSFGTMDTDRPAYILFCLFLCFGAICGVANLLFRPRLSLRASIPNKAVAGEALRIQISLTNIGRMPAFDLSAALLGLPKGLRMKQSSRVAQLRRGESIQFSIEVMPERRGIYVLPPLKAFSLFPFNLMRSGTATLECGPLIVQPHFHPIEEVRVPVAARYQPGGVSLSSNIGESPEYIGNREYQPGDSPRHIDFRAWARLATPAVREFREEYYCRLALVLDTFVPRNRRPEKAGFPDFEAAVSLAAATADALSNGEYLIDIFAAGPELYVFRAGRHTAHLENILEILAGVDVCRRKPFEKIAPALAEALQSISTVICIFLAWDESRAALVRRAEERGCEVKVFILSEGDLNSEIAFPVDDITVLKPIQISKGGIDVL